MTGTHSFSYILLITFKKSFLTMVGTRCRSCLYTCTIWPRYQIYRLNLHMYILFVLATKGPRALIEVIKTASFLQSEYETLFQENELHLKSSLFSGIMHYLMVFLSLSLPSILPKFHSLLWCTFKLLKDCYLDQFSHPWIIELC